MKKIYIKGLSITSVIAPVISLSCASNESEITYINGGYWSKQIIKNPQNKTYIWDANICNSVSDVINIMNKQLHFKFKKNLENMTPYDFGHYVLNLYKVNGGGTWTFKIKYKKKEESVVINTKDILVDFIQKLDGRKGFPGLSYKTKRGNTLGVLTKEGLHINQMSMLLVKYDDLLTHKFSAIGGLIANFPIDSINAFPSFIDTFARLGKQFKASKLAKEWANDRKIKGFNHLEKKIIESVLNSGK